MDDPAQNGTRVPMWVQVLVVVAGIAVVMFEVLRADEPRWPVLMVAMAMMGLLTPDIFDRWKKGP